MVGKIGTYAWIYKNSKSCLVGVIIRSVIALLTSFGSVFTALISKNIIDIATGHQKGSVILNCINIAVIVVGLMLLKMIDNILLTKLHNKLLKVYQKGLFSSFADKKYLVISEYHSGEVVNRLTSDVNTVIDGTVNLLPNAVYAVSKIIVAFIAIALLDIYIAIAAAVLGVLMFFGSRIYGKFYKKLYKKQQKASGVVQSFLQECIANIIVVKTFSQKASVERKLDSVITERNKLSLKKTYVACFAVAFSFLFLSLSYYVVLGWGALQIGVNSAFTYGTLTALLQLFQQIRVPLSDFSGLLPKLFASTASAERLIEIESLPNDCDGNLIGKPLDFDFIEAKGLSFKYADEDEIILSDVNISIKKGSMTLISGESGAGKSTFFKLLLSLYEYEGELNFKVEGNTVPVTARTRPMFAYVPQGNLVLSGTIRENVCFGCSDTVTDEKINDALKTSDIFEFINTLPEGLDTVVGERGLGLSEGQLQRLAVARAILTDAPVLLLDECTSALDEQTEFRLLNNIRALKTKTVILISHKSAAREVCDDVIKLQNKQFAVYRGE